MLTFILTFHDFVRLRGSSQSQPITMGGTGGASILEQVINKNFPYLYVALLCIIKATTVRSSSILFSTS